MAISVNIQAHINTRRITQQLEALRDDDIMYQIHNEFARMCIPYVPMRSGMLANSVLSNVTKDGVTWPGPYAHYQYMGELYLAPNGSAWAKKDEEKYPSGIPLNYSTEEHSLASKEWDKAMMRDAGDVFLNNVKNILMKRFKELYG